MLTRYHTIQVHHKGVNMEENNIQDIVGVVRKIAQQEIKGLNIEIPYFGTIVKANTDKTFDVEVPSNNGVYPSLLNKTGEELKVGDGVIIKTFGSSSSNFYISVKNGATTIVPKPVSITLKSFQYGSDYPINFLRISPNWNLVSELTVGLDTRYYTYSYVGSTSQPYAIQNYITQKINYE